MINPSKLDWTAGHRHAGGGAEEAGVHPAPHARGPRAHCARSAFTPSPCLSLPPSLSSLSRLSAPCAPASSHPHLELHLVLVIFTVQSMLEQYCTDRRSRRPPSAPCTGAPRPLRQVREPSSHLVLVVCTRRVFSPGSNDCPVNTKKIYTD